MSAAAHITPLRVSCCCALPTQATGALPGRETCDVLILDRWGLWLFDLYVIV
jgi:hypothetical protein